MTLRKLRPQTHQNSRIGKLSPSAVARLRPVRYPRKVADGGGLYVLITPSGSRSWRYAYRVAGKQKTLALGKYPDVSLEKARRRHQFARLLLESGIDPSLLKRVVGRHIFGVAAREWILQREFGA